jgi:hypothetical protein
MIVGLFYADLIQVSKYEGDNESLRLRTIHNTQGVNDMIPHLKE